MNLWTGTYSRSADSVTDNEFFIEIDFFEPIVFVALSFKKVDGGKDFCPPQFAGKLSELGEGIHI